MKEKKKHIYLYPLIAAAALRLAGIWFADLSTPALMEYGRIAHNMLSGAGFAFPWSHPNGIIVNLLTAYMPPGQVFIQYAALSVFGDDRIGMIALYLFQIVQACTFIYLLGKITDNLFKSPKITLTTIWMAAIYPPFVYVTMTYGVTSTALVLNALILYIGLQFSAALTSGRKRLQYALLMGLSCGLLLLFRGEAPVIVLATLSLLAYVNRSVFKRSLFYIILSAVVALGVLAPWTIRNYLLFDRFVPISTNGGFNFWRGNNSMTTGSPWTETGGAVWSSDEICAELDPYLDKKADFDKIHSDVHTREALKWIKENPGSAALLSLKKAVILWTIDFRSIRAGTPVYILIYACTLASLITGIFFLRRNKIYHTNLNARTGFSIMTLWCILMTLLAMVFFPLPRFQVLLIGIYFPVMGYGISQIIERYIHRQRRE